MTKKTKNQVETGPKKRSRKKLEATRYIPQVGFANRLPVMPLLSVAVFPSNVLSFIVRKPHNIEMLQEVGDTEKVLCLVGQRDTEQSKPQKLEDLYSIGVAARLIHRMNLPDNSVQVTFQGLQRVKVAELLQTEPYMRAEVALLDEVEGQEDDVEISRLIGIALKLFEQIVHNDPSYSDELTEILRMNIKGPGRFTDMVATFVAFPLEVKNELLAELNSVDRLKRLIDFLEVEVKTNQIELDVHKHVQLSIEKNQREYILRQHLEEIKRELGEGDQTQVDIEHFRKQAQENKLPEHAQRKVEEEIKRLEMLSAGSAEYGIIHSYLDWLITLPWSQISKDNLDLENARKVLDDNHYGLNEVKDRFIEFLAVLKLRGEVSGSILCLQGPPGVGKTSLGKAVAEALGRSFQRISVGGLRDDSEIMGHRRTYVGAMPGKIIDAMKRAKTINPLIMIDEIDKMSSDVRGDPASAMLEVLDPEQNASFRDRYLDVPYDLSKVLFVCTANLLETIPKPLLDRMDVVRLPGYTRQEKFEITKRHLIKRQLKLNGLRAKDFEIKDEALQLLIDQYTREAGVRGLERVIGRACRKVAVKLASGTRRRRHTLSLKNLEDYLGPPNALPDPRLIEAEIGVSTGLAWTPVGGEILFIEATRYKGKGGLMVTGSLGDVMKESVNAALSYVKANAQSLGIDEKSFESYDIHVHFPEGAMPKDGPSAGVTIVTALTSLFTECPIRPDVAMTGEVTLRGKVLQVGGIKEKVIAAHRAGIERVVLPQANAKDLDDIPEEVRQELTFVFSSDVRTNLKEAIIDIVVPRDGMKSKLIVESKVDKNTSRRRNT